MRSPGLAVAAAAIASSALAQPAPGMEKYQPTILKLRACIRANAPPTEISGVRSSDDAIAYFEPRCFPAYNSQLARLGAGDAARGSYRIIVQEEWSAFQFHLGR